VMNSNIQTLGFLQIRTADQSRWRAIEATSMFGGAVADASSRDRLRYCQKSHQLSKGLSLVWSCRNTGFIIRNNSCLMRLGGRNSNLPIRDCDGRYTKRYTRAIRTGNEVITDHLITIKTSDLPAEERGFLVCPLLRSRV